VVCVLVMWESVGVSGSLGLGSCSRVVVIPSHMVIVS
jgi:hypothetical protein